MTIESNNKAKSYTEEYEVRVEPNRAYLKSELAQIVFPWLDNPDSARKALMDWIKTRPALMEALRRSGLRKMSKVLYPHQVRLIMEELDRA